MPMFRKKPVIIEAIQYNGLNAAEIDEFTGMKLERDIVDTAYQAGVAPPVMRLVISTLEGNMIASPGDWVIRGISGEYYPCKPDIFKKTYEPVRLTQCIDELSKLNTSNHEAGKRAIIDNDWPSHLEPPTEEDITFLNELNNRE
jgi:hypothetical protein